MIIFVQTHGWPVLLRRPFVRLWSSVNITPSLLFDLEEHFHPHLYYHPSSIIDDPSPFYSSKTKTTRVNNLSVGGMEVMKAYVSTPAKTLLNFRPKTKLPYWSKEMCPTAEEVWQRGERGMGGVLVPSRGLPRTCGWTDTICCPHTTYILHTPHRQQARTDLKLELLPIRMSTFARSPLGGPYFS